MRSFVTTCLWQWKCRRGLGHLPVEDRCPPGQPPLVLVLLLLTPCHPCHSPLRCPSSVGAPHITSPLAILPLPFTCLATILLTNVQRGPVSYRSIFSGLLPLHFCLLRRQYIQPCMPPSSNQASPDVILHPVTPKHLHY